MGKFLNTRLWAGDLTPFEVLAGRAFDQLNCLNTREFDQNFSKKSNARGSARGTWAVLELTGALPPFARCSLTVLIHTFYSVKLRVKFLLQHFIQIYTATAPDKNIMLNTLTATNFWRLIAGSINSQQHNL